jgi:hypothetical protein
LWNGLLRGTDQKLGYILISDQHIDNLTVQNAQDSLTFIDPTAGSNDILNLFQLLDLDADDSLIERSR